VKGALLERMQFARIATRSLRENPQFDALLLDAPIHIVQRFPGLLAAHPIDEDQASQPGGQAEGPGVEELPFGHHRAFIHHMPDVKHACKYNEKHPMSLENLNIIKKSGIFK